MEKWGERQEEEVEESSSSGSELETAEGTRCVNELLIFYMVETVRPEYSINLNVSFSMEKRELLMWNLNPQRAAYEADALPTELLRQLS